MNKKILILFTVFTVFTSSPLTQAFSEITNTFEYSKEGCELLIFDVQQPTQEGTEIAKKWLNECVEREFITQELADMAPNLTGYGTASVSAAYRFSNGDIMKTIKILQDPNFPDNISDKTNEPSEIISYNDKLVFLIGIGVSIVVIILLYKKKRK